MKVIFLLAAGVAFGAFADGSKSVDGARPAAPGVEEWAFRRELSAWEDRGDWPTNGVTFVRGPVAGYESYRIDVGDGGGVTITTEDDEGLRRAVYYYRDRMRAGDLASCVRKPWLRNRIARCFFGPIKRPPLNHDELGDDIDYYPDAYLDRLAHEGINGLWLTVEWDDLLASERKFAKLNRTIEKCLRFGIRTWIFSIEPKAKPDGRLTCPFSKEGADYIERSIREIFTRAPKLGGIIQISQGERSTTCLSRLDPVTGNWTGFDGTGRTRCPLCAGKEPWEIHNAAAEAIVRGIRAAGSSAEYLSWFYQPHVDNRRAPWSAECARHVPEGVILGYNFESGAVREQLGKARHGGDYWLSYTGPAEGFAAVAAAGRESGARIAAKIQVGNSHECATVPFVPVPGLLYRKYRAMREAGVSSVLQCWYFGNYPGIMNQAAGELAFDDFKDDERTFLRKLAAPEWGRDAGRIAAAWERLSDAYALYPMSNNMQYYGPFHFGPAWELSADVGLRPLARTWMPLEPSGGDTIGEALENHTLAEAVVLSRAMADGARIELPEGRFSRDRELDLGVMRALALQFESAANIFAFYAARQKAVRASRHDGDRAAALAALDEMDRLVVAEQGVSERLLPLAERDSRLGFHSEAESHLYHPALLRWRIGRLAGTRRRIAEIRKAVADGKPYPESEFERTAPKVALGGDWVSGKGGFRFKVARAGADRLRVTAQVPKRQPFLALSLDEVGATLYESVKVFPDGHWETYGFNRVPLKPSAIADLRVTELAGEAWEATYTMEEQAYLSFAYTFGDIIWPEGPAPVVRLNLWFQGDRFGRVVPEADR